MFFGMKFSSIPYRAEEQCRLLRINELLILCKKVETLRFHDIIKLGNVCFMLKRKSFSDSQRTEVFECILFCYQTEIFNFVLFHLNVSKKGDSLFRVEQMTLANATS